MKVTAHSLGQTMAILVVQERHLWLNLVDLQETYKYCFLDSPISQLTAKNCWAKLWASSIPSQPQQQPPPRQQWEVGHRKMAAPVQASTKQSGKSKRPWDGRPRDGSPPHPTHAFWVGSLCFTTLPHCGYICGSSGPTCTASGSPASAPQPISLAHSDHQTQLCDSVCLAPSSGASSSPPCWPAMFLLLTGRNHSPTTEGHDRASPSSQYEVKVLQPNFSVYKKGGGLRPILSRFSLGTEMVLIYLSQLGLRVPRWVWQCGMH